MSAKDEPKPNLIWPASEKSDPPEFIRDGREVIEMPPPGEMRLGFYSFQPERLKKLTGGRLKEYRRPLKQKPKPKSAKADKKKP